jgi:signal transduction histidine kinase
VLQYPPESCATFATRLTVTSTGIAESTTVGIQVDTLGDAEVSVDKALFRRAMSNLLHNAIQYSPIGATLRIEMRSRSDSVEVPGLLIAKAIAKMHGGTVFANSSAASTR